MSAHSMSDPARQPDRFFDPARPQVRNDLATPAGPVHSHVQTPMSGGAMINPINPRVWSNLWGMLQVAFGSAVVWWILVTLIAAFLMLFVVSGVMGMWIQKLASTGV